MRAFFLVSCLAVAAVMARPEPPLYMGLQQQDQRALPLNAHAAKPHVYQQLPQDQSFGNFMAPVPTYGAPDASASPDTIAPAAPEFSAVEMPIQEDSYNAAYQHSAGQSHQSGYDNGPTETQVHKHIYVHVPPKDFEDDEAVQPRVTHQAGPKQKHYKIVFIKAPSAPAMRAPVVAPAPQNEEKTLIYVLHKKPEAQPDIVIPAPAPTKPSKPEVFFIKYKTKKEEAPVYGPPPANMDMEARQAPESSSEYDAPMENDNIINNNINNNNNNYMPMDLGQYEMVPTTQQPIYEEEQGQQQPQFVQEEPTNEANVYNAPTMSAYANEEVQPTAAEPLNQYISPETTPAPIVVEDIVNEQPRAPAVSYGPPARYFLKKRK